MAEIQLESSIKRRFLSIVTLVVLSMVMFFSGVLPTQAATYKWANTQQGYGKLKVRFCDGETRTLSSGNKTSKDVCAFYLPYGKEAYVYVKETGTILFDVAYCPANSSAGKWYTFSSKNDTSRTALANTFAAKCA